MEWLYIVLVVVIWLSILAGYYVGTWNVKRTLRKLV